MTDTTNLPVAIIGAGPIGLAAAANLVERGITPLILEGGSQIAASMRDWGHVRLFTPWTYLIDPVSKRLLEAGSDWQVPDGDGVPLAKELVGEYLGPLARLNTIAPHIKLDHKVIAVARDGHDRMKNGKRESAPFLIVTETPNGPRRFKARAVIDASGSWTSPNPLGAGGVLADGEEAHQNHIRYGMPDVLGRDRSRFAGKRTLVVGSGHSAIGSVLGLVELASEDENTSAAWAVRQKDPRKLWGGGKTDEIAARGALGTRVHEAVHSGTVSLLTGLSISAVRKHSEGTRGFFLKELMLRDPLDVPKQASALARRNNMRSKPVQTLLNYLHDRDHRFLFLLASSKWFRTATVACFLIILALPLVTIPWIQSTPSGFSPEIKISPIDWIQARSLGRTARSFPESVEDEIRFATWRQAIGNDQGNLALNRAYLAALISFDQYRNRWQDAIQTSLWLQHLSPHKRQNDESICLTFSHYRFHQMVID
jgi:hypothetical protein